MSDFELLIDKIQELIKEDGAAAGGAVGGAVGGDATPGMVPAQTASGNPSVSYLPGEFAANKKRKKNKKIYYLRGRIKWKRLDQKIFMDYIIILLVLLP